MMPKDATILELSIQLKDMMLAICMRNQLKKFLIKHNSVLFLIKAPTAQGVRSTHIQTVRHGGTCQAQSDQP